MPTWEMLASDGGSAASLPVGLARYIALPGSNESDTAEAINQHEANDSYSASRLMARITVNAATAASTFRFRRNGANGAQVLSIGAGATGLFEDAINSDALDNGDLYAVQQVNGGGGGISWIWTGMNLAHVTLHVPIQGASGVTSITASQLFAIGGKLNPNPTEANSLYTIRSQATSSNFRIRISFNTRDAVTTYNFRRNGANGNENVSVAAATTGTFEDAVNTDVMASGDTVNILVEILAGAGSIRASAMSMKWLAERRPIIAAFPDGVGFLVDAFITPGGGLTASTTESPTQKPARTDFIARNYFARIIAHGASGGVTAALRRNGVNTACSVSIPATATGIFENAVDSASFVSGDLYNHFFDHGGGAGSITPSIAAFLFEQPATPPPPADGDRGRFGNAGDVKFDESFSAEDVVDDPGYGVEAYRETTRYGVPRLRDQDYYGNRRIERVEE